MPFFRFIWLALVSVWMLPGISAAAAPEIPAPRSFNLWTVTTGGGSGIVVGVIPYEVSGKIAICGAIWPVNEKRQGIDSRDRVFREAIIEIRGQVVKANLNIFAVFDTQDAAKTFRCSVSNQPWQGPYKLDEFNLRLRTSRIRD